MISYDLAEPNVTPVDHGRVIDRIKALGPWAHISQSVWLTGAAMSAEEINDDLRSVLRPDDRLFVAHLTDWAGTNLTDGRLAWLQKRSIMIGEEQ